MAQIIEYFDNITVDTLNSGNIHLLPEFMESCQKLGYKNNSSERDLKLSLMHPPYGQYWVTISDEKMTGISGVHKFPEIDIDAWRVMFRLAVLPSSNKTYFSKNPILSSVHFSKVLPQQIQFGREQGGTKFFITSNTHENEKDNSGKSFKVDKIFMPYMAKLGIVSLYKENVELFHTKQNVWLLDLEKYAEYNLVSTHLNFIKKK